MNTQRGFTLVELILAIAFFSFILLFVLVGFVQINRSYTRGITVKEIQNNAREVVDILSDAIRNADANSIETINNPRDGRLCLGGVRYAWNQSDATGNFGNNSIVGGGPYTLVRTLQGTLCSDPIQYYVSGSLDSTQTVIAQGIIVQHISVNRIGSAAGSSNSYSITVVLSSDARANPNDFSSFGIDATCEIQIGDQFCDVARIDTVVTARN